MYIVNYTVPTARGYNDYHSIIVNTMQEVDNIRKQCKKYNYNFLSYDVEHTYRVEFKDNGYNCVHIIKDFNAENAKHRVFHKINNVVDCVVTEIN